MKNEKLKEFSNGVKQRISGFWSGRKGTFCVDIKKVATILFRSFLIDFKQGGQNAAWRT
jgi:hypothetical protein